MSMLFVTHSMFVFSYTWKASNMTLNYCFDVCFSLKRANPLQHGHITQTFTALMKPMCWNKSTFSSVQWGATGHFKNHQMIIKHFSSEYCIPIWSWSSEWKASLPAPEHICGISKLSFLPFDDIHFEGKKATFQHASKHLFISTRAKSNRKITTKNQTS